ncbi:MAG TPA: heavy metal-responsive transcriptional regulator [Ilumatobacteraceae bacterium]|nr:heavy metal-responsive transcriptional regulator [Ilumatobacteraceae bacterium]
MRIGTLAQHAGVTTKTIRYYESIHLLAEPLRIPSGYREYGDDAVERLRFIRDAQLSGLSLAEIQSVLELKDAGARSCGHTMALLDRHLAEIDEQIARLEVARTDLLDLVGRARGLDPANCTDPHRCQVIAGGPK